VEVADSGADVEVTEQSLDHAQIGAGFQAVGSKGMTIMPGPALAPLCRVPDYAGWDSQGRVRRGIPA
jgi:hypothetical protein